MSGILRPLLAVKADYSKIRYPVLATPKLDGIRCIVIQGKAMSRSMKPIPNDYIRSKLTAYDGLDGELMVRGDFNNVQSAVMSKYGRPNFTYVVFDYYPMVFGYNTRVSFLKDDVLANNTDLHIKLLIPKQIDNEQELDAYMDVCIAEGYEGVIIRAPQGIYKQGRSTVNEGIMLKIKRFIDDEGKIVSITEKMTNYNSLEYSETGYAKRSSHMDNLVPAGTAGSITLMWRGRTFKVGFGPGITDSIKQDMWDRRKELLGSLATFRYQELSKDGVPRFGKMLKLRHKDDI